MLVRASLPGALAAQAGPGHRMPAVAGKRRKQRCLCPCQPSAVLLTGTGTAKLAGGWVGGGPMTARLAAAGGACHVTPAAPLQARNSCRARFVPAPRADVGTAHIQRGTYLSDLTGGAVGTLAWMSPEVMMGQKCGWLAGAGGAGMGRGTSGVESSRKDGHLVRLQARPAPPACRPPPHRPPLRRCPARRHKGSRHLQLRGLPLGEPPSMRVCVHAIMSWTRDQQEINDCATAPPLALNMPAPRHPFPPPRRKS